MKPLHDLEKLSANQELKERTLKAVMQKRSKKKKYILFGLIGSIACICLALVLQLSLQQTTASPLTEEIYAYVSVDINPSMEFQLDKNDQVINVIAYNEDATQILRQADMKGCSIDETINWLLSNESIQEYMTTGFMQVGVYSDDSEHSLMLEEQLNNSLSKHLNASQYGCSCVSNESHQEASKHEMSFGKYQAIELIIQLDDQYTLEELSVMNMHDIKSIYESLSGNQYPQKHQNKQNRNGSHHGQ